MTMCMTPAENKMLGSELLSQLHPLGIEIEIGEPRLPELDEIKWQLFEMRVEWLVYLMLRKYVTAGEMQDAASSAAYQKSIDHCDTPLLAYARTFVEKLKEKT